MRIGIISDTHIPGKRQHFPEVIRQIFKGVDLILHAGDLNDLTVLKTLNSIAPTEAVAGNTDSEGMVDYLGYQKQLELSGFRIGLTHGHLGKGATTPDRAFSLFPEADVIVFGHSHKPWQEWRDGKLLLNPGSATDRRQEKQHSVAILTLGEQIKSEIIYFD